MENGFGDIKADMNSMKADIKSKFGELGTKIEGVGSDFKLTKWASSLAIWRGTSGEFLVILMYEIYLIGIGYYIARQRLRRTKIP